MFSIAIFDCAHKEAATVSLGLGNITQENATNQAADVFGRVSATASFGLGYSFLVARTPAEVRVGHSLCAINQIVIVSLRHQLIL